MKNIKSFKTFNKSINESDEQNDDIFNDESTNTDIIGQVESELREYLDGADIDYTLNIDENGPSAEINIKKTSSCFNSDSMDSFFSSHAGRERGGLAKGGFMSDYTQLEEMSDQIQVIDSLINSMSDIENVSYQRCYISGDSIRIELNILA